MYSQDKCINNSLKEESENDEVYLLLRKISVNLSKRMDHLISLYPDIQFKNFTLNKYNFKSKNIENIYVDI